MSGLRASTAGRTAAPGGSARWYFQGEAALEGIKMGMNTGRFDFDRPQEADAVRHAETAVTAALDGT